MLLTWLAGLGVALAIVPHYYADTLLWLDPFAHLKPWYVGGGLLLTGIWAYRKAWRTLALAAAITLWIAWPLYQPTAQNTPTKGHLTIASFNAWFSNTQQPAILEMLNNQTPDIVGIVETSTQTLQALHTLNTLYPWQYPPVRHHWNQQAILSRYPILNTRLLPVPDSRRVMTLATILTPNGRVSVLLLHAPSPKSIPAIAERNRQLATISHLSHTLPHPLIIMGDFNSTPWTPAFARMLATANLRLARPGHTLPGTWPAWLPAPLRLPIDHILTSPTLTVTRQATLPACGSDHRPLMVAVAW